MLKVIIKSLEDGKEISKEYEYDGDLNIPVTTLLERINYDNDTKIHYSSSCLQGLCGSCAMLINNMPKLACKTFVNEEIMTEKFHKITLEPLSKFPVIKDLIIDRDEIHENMKRAQQWLETKAQINKKTLSLEYELSQCLMCGCCVEACPNYNNENIFQGAILPVSQAKITQQEQDKEKLKQQKKYYKEHFYNNCVKSLVCNDVCPMEISTQRAISSMNHKSIWRIFNLFK